MMNRRNLFDRVALYRWAALALSVSFVRSIYTLVDGSMPFTGWRLALWIGYGLLVFAVVRDFWGIYQVRKGMHSSINKLLEKQKEG